MNRSEKEQEGHCGPAAVNRSAENIEIKKNKIKRQTEERKMQVWRVLTSKYLLYYAGDDYNKT